MSKLMQAHAKGKPAVAERIDQAQDDRVQFEETQTERSAIDCEFEDCLRRHECGASRAAAAVGKWLCAALRQGHSCATLEELAPYLSHLGGAKGVHEDLRQSSLVAVVGADRGKTSFRPLVLDLDRVYLHRYWEYECCVAEEIQQRATLDWPPPLPTRLEQDLTTLFPEGSDPLQREAARMGATRGLTIIAGGPGTGKTTTILRTLALIAGQEEGDRPLDVALAAPTGKAANRMGESIRAGLAQLGPIGKSIEARLPPTTATLHRLLGMREDSLTPRYDRHHPLPQSTVIVDETSMVDLPMMARLLGALRPDARLILLGDANQLASVEVGSIFADILAATELNSALHSCTVRLTRNYRFSETSALHRFCAALNARNEDAGLKILAQGQSESGAIRLEEPPLHALPDALAEQTFFQGYEAAWSQFDVKEVLGGLGRQRILCAIHAGPCGVDRFNAHVERLLAKRGYLQPIAGGSYAREPIILTRNDHQLRLFNGDTGVLDRQGGRLEACFLEGHDTLRRVPAMRLPPFSPAYAITIHRSQGSEFDHVLVVLPPAPNKCLTRELLYTAVSRARLSVTLWARESDVRECFRNGVSRASGLARRLAG